MSYAALSAYAAALSADYANDVPTAEDQAWEGSSFNWIRQQAPGTKGKIGRDLARSILEALGITVGTEGTALTANGITIRSKLSMEWGAGAFKFQQIRDEPFEYVFCLGIYPEGCYGWLIPRSDLIVDGVWQERPGLTPQHGGVGGTDTYWLSVDPANPPAWLGSYGGPLQLFETVLSNTF